MGLKDVVERLAGKPKGGKRGARKAPEQKRDRDEATVQVPIAGMPSGTQSPPPQPPRAPAPPVVARPQPVQPAPPAPAPPVAPPRAAAPPPQAAPSTPVAPKPPAPAASSGDATMYQPIPQIQTGRLIGLLVGISGELKGEIYRIKEGDNRLGRALECDVQLLDAQISREHAMIVCEEGALAVLPLQDKNPIFLNEDPVDDGAELSDGDKLRLGSSGSSEFRFRTIEGP